MRLACLFTTLLLVWAPRGARAAEPALAVNVDPRVELLSIIFRLAGNPEYSQGKVASYVADVEAHFGKHRQHAAIETARRLRREYGVSFDAVMSMAVHVEDARTLKEAVPFSPRPAELDRRWRVADARLFLDKARRFAEETDFAGFLKEHQPLFDTAVTRFHQVVEESAGFDWFDRFFGARPGARFTVALGMLNGGACYGPRIRISRKREDLYCILGVWSTDDEGLPRFDRDMLSTVAHEFCHSYVNWLVDKNEKKLKKAGETIYPLVASEMKRQAYGNWKTMMCESLVRASVVRYVHATRGPEAAQKEVEAQVGRSFRWTPQLSELLEEYEAQRKRYKTLEAFMPRVAAFFKDYAPDFAKEQEKRAAGEPKVVSMTPENGATGVDPSLKAITVTFSRRMQDRMWAFVGGGPHFPETTGRPSYDKSRKTVTLPVKLKPSWSYEFWLNRGKYNTFRSEENVPLKPVRVTFRTGPAR
ncbi:MAG: DUF4932 domain-containing protein [Planctomycetota bacterium]|jgi:hypothetical protein